MRNIFRRCKHENVRCVHGDEVIFHMRLRRPYFARAFCLDCNRPLYGHDLPLICTVTSTLHPMESRHLK